MNHYVETSRRDIMSQYFEMVPPVSISGIQLSAPTSQTNFETLKWSGQNSSGLGSLLKKKQKKSVYSEKVSHLPIEVKVRITNNLNQHDLVKLASVSKYFYDAAMFSLYETVVVDSSFSILNDTLGISKVEKCTYIKTKYNLKKFMRVLSQDSIKTAYPLGILVKSLKIIRLPDGVSNIEIAEFVHKSIRSLSRLSCLYWESGSRKLPPDTLEYLPNKKELVSLAVNLDLSKYEGNSMRFPQLEKFSIAPFVNSENLTNFMSQISKEYVAYNIKVLQLKRQLPTMRQISKNMNQGQSLIVTNFMIENQLRSPDSDESDKFLNHALLDCHFWGFLDPFLETNQIFTSLRVLDVDGINFLSTDSHKVLSAIDLSQLETLSLNNVNEMQWLNAVDFLVTDFTSLVLQEFHPPFLLMIAPHLKLLKRVRLNYREPCRDSIPRFLSTLADAGVSLEEIDITIHWSKEKLATVTDWHTLMQNYARSICKHKNTLSKLSLDAQEDLSYYRLPISLPENILFMLTDCIYLKSLRINGDSLQPNGIYLLNKFPSLTYLCLHGKKSGGPPHMGLQTVHDGIMDDWYRVIHVATNLSHLNKNLQFIMIDKCLFHRNQPGHLVPHPDTLDAWFFDQTRVIVSDGDF